MSVDKIHQAEVSSDPKSEEVAAMQQEVGEFVEAKNKKQA